jgi:hypothetical protein
MKQKLHQKVIEKAVPKEALKKNATALEFYEEYKKTSDLIDRANFAMGRKAAFKTETGSTIHFEINQHGIASTTTEKI